MPTVIRAAVVVLGLLLAGVTASSVLSGGSSESAYAEQVARACETTERELQELRGNYFQALLFISERKHDRLSRITPPPGRAALHADLLRAEAGLARDARPDGATNAVLVQRFPALRERQAALESRYRELGVTGCSD